MEEELTDPSPSVLPLSMHVWADDARIGSIGISS